MEHIDGKSLAHLIERGELRLPDVLRYAESISGFHLLVARQQVPGNLCYKGRQLLFGRRQVGSRTPPEYTPAFSLRTLPRGPLTGGGSLIEAARREVV